MFYMKHKGKKLEIRDDNVYTQCPRCGKEHNVDLQEVLGGDGDLYSTRVFCSLCSDIRQAERAYGRPMTLEEVKAEEGKPEKT